jgi:hypothetical protein
MLTISELKLELKINELELKEAYRVNNSALQLILLTQRGNLKDMLLEAYSDLLEGYNSKLRVV